MWTHFFSQSFFADNTYLTVEECLQLHGVEVPVPVLIVEVEECLGVKVLLVQSVLVLPHILQLLLAGGVAKVLVILQLLLHLLKLFLCLSAVLAVHLSQLLSPSMLHLHLVATEFLLALFVKVSEDLLLLWGLRCMCVCVWRDRYQILRISKTAQNLRT